MDPAPAPPALPAAVARRVKRKVIARQHRFFAVTSPGLEELCARQLKDLVQRPETVALRRGGVAFTGRLTDAYLANLHLRYAQRVLMRIAHIPAPTFAALEKGLSTIDWACYLPAGCGVRIQVACHRSRLYHSGAVAQRLARAIQQAVGATAVSTGGLRLYGRLDHDLLTLSLDSSGTPLYRRGLKEHHVPAPLRETLAAAVLAWVGYRPEESLVDPMCGSGTFSLEAATAACRIPAGWFRRFAFESWPAFRPRHWAWLRKQAGQTIHLPRQPSVFASDIDPRACADLAERAARFHLQDVIRVETADVFHLAPPPVDRPGWVVINPPYGRRLAAGDGDRFYEKLARRLERTWRNWHLAVVVPQRALAALAPLGLARRPLRHGGLHLQLAWRPAQR